MEGNMKISTSFLLVAGSSFLAIAFCPTTASAVAPKVETQTVHVDAGVVRSCPGFDVTATFEATRRITTFYDAAGTPIRQHVHGEIPGTVTNSVSGKSLPTKGIRNITRDLITGEVQSTGTNVHVVVPGRGTVMLASGLFRIDEEGNLAREVGRQDEPVTPALCEALN
jgi:hypothetical protein